MRRGFVFMCVVLAMLTPSPGASQTLDDRPITVAGRSSIAARRQALIDFIWGSDGFPHSKQPAVTAAIPLPIRDLVGVARSDRLTFAMSHGITTEGWHLVPQVREKDRLVIVHQGHSPDCSFDDRYYQNLAAWKPGSGMDGVWRAVQNLIAEGYSVMAMFLPRYSPNDCSYATQSHDELGQMSLSTGSPLKFFLEPVAMALNHFQSLRNYTDFSMVGFSGGAWTTVAYAAIDPRITLSFPVGGPNPLHLSYFPGDFEHSALSSIAGYSDLFVMGSSGSGRKQVQVHNRRDSCCGGEISYIHDPTRPGWNNEVREYEARVREAVARAGAGGAFRVEIDEAATHHTLSYHTQINIVLGELNDGRRPIGAATNNNAFLRSASGRLLRATAAAQTDTGISAVGVPAVLEGAEHDMDIFYRDPDRPGWASPEWDFGNYNFADLGATQRLRRAYLSNGTWTEQELPEGCGPHERSRRGVVGAELVGCRGCRYERLQGVPLVAQTGLAQCQTQRGE